MYTNIHILLWNHIYCVRLNCNIIIYIVSSQKMDIFIDPISMYICVTVLSSPLHKTEGLYTICKCWIKLAAALSYFMHLVSRN